MKTGQLRIAWRKRTNVNWRLVACTQLIRDDALVSSDIMALGRNSRVVVGVQKFMP
jgi:hypothetical protein